MGFFIKSPHFLHVIFSVELQVAVLDPAEAAADHIDERSKDGGQHDGDEDEAQPVKARWAHGRRTLGDSLLARGDPARPHADEAAQAAGAHTGVDRRTVHLKMEHACGDGAGDGGGERRRDPDAGISDNVRHLEHRRAEALRDKAAPAVFLKAHHGEADHLRAAACDGRAAGKARQAQHRADGGGRDRQRERDADKHRDRDTHPERLEFGRIVDDNAKCRGRRADGRRDPLGERDADQDGHGGRDQNVDLRLLAHGLAALGGKDRDDENGKRAARAALGVGRPAHRGKGEEHHRVSLERVADGDRHRRAGDGHRIGADVRQKRNAQLRAERLDDRADEQRAEEALRHCAERIDAVALGRNFNVFAFAERFEFFHDILTA